MKENHITIEETTVGDLAGVQVGMGNVIDDGGLTCTLAPFDTDENIPVRVLDDITIGDVVWKVADIQKGDDGKLGSVTLEPLYALKFEGGSVSTLALDYSFSRECPQCNRRAGWNGRIEKKGRDITLEHVCPQCGNEFDWFSGAHQAEFKKKTPVFIPGRKYDPDVL